LRSTPCGWVGRRETGNNAGFPLCAFAFPLFNVSTIVRPVDAGSRTGDREMSRTRTLSALRIATDFGTGAANARGNVACSRLHHGSLCGRSAPARRILHAGFLSAVCAPLLLLAVAGSLSADEPRRASPDAPAEGRRPPDGKARATAEEPRIVEAE